MGGRGSLNSMPQLRHSDGGDFEFLCLFAQPVLQVEVAPLAFDDHVGVEDYCHRFLTGLSALRAAFKSLYQARASSFVRSTCSSALANCAPVQLFLLSGIRRATGEPFLSRTKVT